MQMRVISPLANPLRETWCGSKIAPCTLPLRARVQLKLATYSVAKMQDSIVGRSVLETLLTLFCEIMAKKTSKMSKMMRWQILTGEAEGPRVREREGPRVREREGPLVGEREGPRVGKREGPPGRGARGAQGRGASERGPRVGERERGALG